MKKVQFDEVFKYLPKSKRQAGTGLTLGKYPFYTSSGDLTKYTNEADYSGNCLIFGTGGNASVHYQNMPFSTSTDCIVAAPVDNKDVSCKYIHQFLKSNMQILENGFKGAGLKHISKGYISNIQIPLPPLDDQIRIAEVLTRAEKLIAKRKESIKVLDDLLKSTFLDMFGEPVRNAKGWEKVPLSKFGEIITGNTPPRGDSSNFSNNFIEWIKTDNIVSNVMYLTKASEYLSESGLRRSRFVTSGALLVACIAGSVESIGRSAIADRKVSFNQQINAIQPNSNVNTLFLYSLFKQTKLYIQSHATKGMKKILTKGDFQKILMILPPLPLQNQYAFIVEKVESIKSKFNHSHTELENLYSSISQRAFKGDLDLSKVPLPDKEAELEEVPMLPFDEGLSEETKKALADLNAFNNNSETFKAIQEATRSLDLNSPTLRIAREMAEQAALWKTPMDELKNMSSIARSLAEITKPSLAIQNLISKQFKSLQATANIASQIANSIPKIDFSFLTQQKELMESALQPFSQMQEAMANITLPMKGIADSIESLSQIENSFVRTMSDANEEEYEPKRIFTRYDIIDALADGVQLSFSGLTDKLSELEIIDMIAYERIRELLFDLLKDGEVAQFFDENNPENKIIKFKAVI